jgi:dienelactone hydrolase
MPVIVWVHGGGFMQNSSKDENVNAVEHSRKWASQGFLVFSIEYRRWGDWLNTRTLDDPVQDTLTAVRYITTNAATLDADARNIGLVGCSAGGVTVSHANIFATPSAAAAPATASLTHKPQFAFVISISGGLVPNAVGPRVPGSPTYPWPPFTRTEEVRPQLSIVSRLDTDAYAREVATHDTVLHTLLTNSTVPHDLIVIPGAVHCPSYDTPASDTPGDENLFKRMLGFAIENMQTPHCSFMYPCAQEVSSASQHTSWFVRTLTPTRR